MATVVPPRVRSAKSELDGFIEKYAPEIAADGRAALAGLGRMIPDAVQLVYDNYNWLVVGFSPTDRPSDAVLSLVFTPRWITLCFLLSGPSLDDPSRLLRGSGKRVRSVRLKSAKDLKTPAIRALIDQALALDWKAPPLLPSNKLVIRSISARQRPRRLQ